jgi:hypothetical protein
VAYSLFILHAATVAFKRFRHKQKAALIDGNLRNTNMSARVLRGRQWRLDGRKRLA